MCGVGQPETEGRCSRLGMTAKLFLGKSSVSGWREAWHRLPPLGPVTASEICGMEGGAPLGLGSAGSRLCCLVAGPLQIRLEPRFPHFTMGLPTLPPRGVVRTHLHPRMLVLLYDLPRAPR